MSLDRDTVGRHVRDLNMMFWSTVRMVAAEDIGEACAMFGLSRSLAQNLARLAPPDIVRLADSSDLHFTINDSNALAVLLTQIEAGQDDELVGMSRLAMAASRKPSPK
jgi:hypothetical protein